MFAESNVKLEFDENYYDEVVEKAIKSGTGTRALNSIVKASISAAAFEPPEKIAGPPQIPSGIKRRRENSASQIICQTGTPS